MTINEQNVEYIPPSQEEHDKIAAYLEKNFLPYLDAIDKPDVDPKKLLQLSKMLKKIFTAYRESQRTISTGLGEYVDDHSVVSRGVDELNEIFREFCGRKIETPIQIMFHHLDAEGKSKNVRCHLSCTNAKKAKSRGKDAWHSHNIVPLDEAMGDMIFKEFREKPHSKYPSDYQSLSLEIGQQVHSLPMQSDETSKSQDRKYFRDMKDVLRWNDQDTTEQWFRKGGPFAVDIQCGTICKRKVTLDKIHGCVSQHPITILEGKAGSGKSVLIRQLACDMIEANPELSIYYYSLKDDLSISDYHTFMREIDNLPGIIIIEDIHLARENIFSRLNDSRGKSGQKILLTVRASAQMMAQYGLQGGYTKQLNIEPYLNVDLTDEEVDEIIDNYTDKKQKRGFTFTANHKNSIRKVSEKNLWLLSFALMGCDDKKGKGDAETWIEAGVKNDFEQIKRAGCNLEVLLALSPLYMNEVLTADTFLVEKLGIQPSDIEKLLDRCEIVKVVENHQAYYGLPHSTLAKLYWRFRDDSIARCLKYLEETPYDSQEEAALSFIYNYATYRRKKDLGIANGLSAILKMDYPARSLMLQQLDIDRDAIVTVTSETNIETVFEWIRSYAFYFSQKPTDNIWAKVIIPRFFSKSARRSRKFTHETITEMRVKCDDPKNKVRLENIVRKLSKKQSPNPSNISEIMLILSYVNKEVMVKFWQDVDYDTFVESLLKLDLYSLSQNITCLFWLGKKYGEGIWSILDKERLRRRFTGIEEDILVPKGIGTLTVYLPEEIRQEFVRMFDIDRIVSDIAALSGGFCRDYYIAVFSLFNSAYKERLEDLFDADSFIKHMLQANLVELSICIKYIFDTYPGFKTGLYHKLAYDSLVARFYQEEYLDGVLRVVESIYRVSPEAGRKLCRKLDPDIIGCKLKQEQFQYKTKEQFVEFICYIDPSVGETLLEKADM